MFYATDPEITDLSTPPAAGHCDAEVSQSDRIRVRAKMTDRTDDPEPFSPDPAALAASQWIRDVALIRDQQDQEAFARLFGHFAPRIKAFLIKGGATPSVAEDCAQDVMVTVWRKAYLFDPARASVATWVFTIARNRRIDILRKDKRPEPEDLGWGPQPEPEQEENLVLQQESTKLGQAIAALPEKQRQLVEQAYYKDLTHREIADITGLPLGTIKSRIRLALDRLRHAMG
jgi:RNA polymerase sigma-70 factor (ECF subfamily)